MLNSSTLSPVGARSAMVVEVATQLTAAQIRAGLVSADEVCATFGELVRDIGAVLNSDQPNTTTDNVLAFPRSKPAVPIEESVQPDHLICLEDGKQVRILTRYLKRFGMTPAEYRQKWGLPADYPMTAPNLTERKKTYAKLSGLGKHPRT